MLIQLSSLHSVGIDNMHYDGWEDEGIRSISSPIRWSNNRLYDAHNCLYLRSDVGVVGLVDLSPVGVAGLVDLSLESPHYSQY